jgi:hypothetical protein
LLVAGVIAVLGAWIGGAAFGAGNLVSIAPGTYQLFPGTYTWVCPGGIHNGPDPGYWGVANITTCKGNAPPPTTTTTTKPPPTTTTTTTVPPTTTTTTQPVNTGLSLGSYNGNSNVSGENAWDQETGTTSTNYGDYVDGTSFGTMCSGSDTPESNLVGQLGNRTLILSVWLAGASRGVNGQSTMQNYVNNPSQWDSCFQTLGRELVADGFGNAIIRLMWEEDAGIFSNDDLTSAQNYATLWQDAVTNMRSVSGQAFKFAWYWGGNFDNQTNTAAYPGNQYVDYVSFDQYDQSWDGSCGISWGSTWTAAQSQCIWDGDIGAHLASLLSFAQGVGKPIGIGEWGVINRGDGHGGMDDPTYINNMTAWLKAHAVWENYFNFNSGGDSILSDFPNSLAAFRADL